MNIKDRKPRKSRFQADEHEARLARMKEEAPDLLSSRRITYFALVGAVLMVMALAGFYFAMEIYKAAGVPSEDPSFMQVDSAGQVQLSSRDVLIQRIAEEEAQAEIDYDAIVSALKEFEIPEDILEPELEREAELEAARPQAPEVEVIEDLDPEKMPEFPVSGW